MCPARRGGRLVRVLGRQDDVVDPEEHAQPVAVVIARIMTGICRSLGYDRADDPPIQRAEGFRVAAA